jgi:hypothetical protein
VVLSATAMAEVERIAGKNIGIIAKKGAVCFFFTSSFAIHFEFT